MNALDNYDKFSFSRFKMLAKREIISNKRIFLMELAVVAGLIIIAEFFISWLSLPSPKETGSYYWTSAPDRTTVSIIFALGLCGFSLLSNISASLTCSGLSNKKGRINCFMTVGTQSEKYLLNFLIYNVFLVIYYFVVWLLVDLVRVLIIDAVYPLKGTWIPFFAADTMEWMPTLFVIAMLLFNQAFYTLVSAFSPKLAFLKAFGISYALGILAIPYLIFCSFFDINGDSDLIITVASIVLIIFSINMQLLAYYRFKETDIV